MSLNLLFKNGENIYLTNKPRGYEKTATLESLPEQLPQYMAVNPLVSSNRNSESVSSYRNFVFEHDNLPLQDQLEMWQNISKAVPLRGVVFSGSKSYHVFISIIDTQISNSIEYKQQWKALKGYFATIDSRASGLDEATKDAARLCRTPNALRDNGNLQAVISTGEPITMSFLYGLHNPTQTKAVSYGHLPTPETLKELVLFLKNPVNKMRTLYWTFCRPEFWAQPSGNYNRLYKDSLWLIESLGLSEEIFWQLYELYTEPALIKCGYAHPRLAAEHALKFWNSKNP